LTARLVVLVSLGEATPGEALLAGVLTLREAGHQVALISRTAPAPELAEALQERLAVGRGVLAGATGQRRIGKLLIDPHRLPGAAEVLLRRSTRHLLTSADALVAADAAALPAVWLAARVNRASLAVNGLPAAVTRLVAPPGPRR
jgi:hypothetical protein